MDRHLQYWAFAIGCGICAIEVRLARLRPVSLVVTSLLQ
jgi:hypothetical protein